MNTSLFIVDANTGYPKKRMTKSLVRGQMGRKIMSRLLDNNMLKVRESNTIIVIRKMTPWMEKMVKSWNGFKGDIDYECFITEYDNSDYGMAVLFPPKYKLECTTEKVMCAAIWESLKRKKSNGEKCEFLDMQIDLSCMDFDRPIPDTVHGVSIKIKDKKIGIFQLFSSTCESRHLLKMIQMKNLIYSYDVVYGDFNLPEGEFLAKETIALYKHFENDEYVADNFPDVGFTVTCTLFERVFNWHKLILDTIKTNEKTIVGYNEECDASRQCIDRIYSKGYVKMAFIFPDNKWDKSHEQQFYRFFNEYPQKIEEANKRNRNVIDNRWVGDVVNDLYLDKHLFQTVGLDGLLHFLFEKNHVDCLIELKIIH